jgi:hypothetical protein
MPSILAPTDYRWLIDEPDPRDLMRPFPAEPMRMWSISTRVNKPENDDPLIVEPIALALDRNIGGLGAAEKLDDTCPSDDAISVLPSECLNTSVRHHPGDLLIEASRSAEEGAEEDVNDD